MSKGASGVRYAEVDRETLATRIHLVLDLDGGTRCDVSTGIGFLDHMLREFAFHGLLDLGITADGDLSVDDHHTVEDVATALGQAIAKALAESEGLARFGDCRTPVDDALVTVAVDLCGRPYCACDLPLSGARLGTMAAESVGEFFRHVAMNAGLTLHIRLEAGMNDHHIAEAAFKGFGRALHAATRRTERKGPISAKGAII